MPLATGTWTLGCTGTPTSGRTGTLALGCTGTPTSGGTGTLTLGCTGTPTSGRTGTLTLGCTGTLTSGRTGTWTRGCRGTLTASHTGTLTSGCTRTWTPSCTRTMPCPILCSGRCMAHSAQRKAGRAQRTACSPRAAHSAQLAGRAARRTAGGGCVRMRSAWGAVHIMLRMPQGRTTCGERRSAHRAHAWGAAHGERRTACSVLSTMHRVMRTASSAQCSPRNVRCAARAPLA